MLADAAQWIAPAATMIAAMMTAANLGARVTGWGFVVFTLGAIGWIVQAIATGQRNLLIANAFLLLVDVVGIWRWLGRRARYDEGAQAASAPGGRRAAADGLFALGTLEGRPVRTADGADIGTIVDAMARHGDGAIDYLVVSAGGIGGVGETLHAIGWHEVRIEEDAFVTALDRAALERRPALRPSRWPKSAEAAGAGAGAR